MLYTRIITVPYLSRVLGSSENGEYGYTVSIVSYFIILGSCGISLYGQREIAYYQSDRKKKSKIFWELFIIKLFTTLISMIVFGLIFCIDRHYSLYYRILLLEFIANIIDISWLYQGEENFKLTKKEELYGVGACSTTGRIYKGEGQLNFTAYTPYAKSRFKYADQYTLKNIPEWGSMDSYGANDVYFNLYDWVDSSRMVKSGTAKKINKISYKLDEVLPSGVLVYNAGDLPTNFILRFYFTGIMPKCIIGDVDTNHLGLSDFELYNSDAGIQINSKLNLIEGINEKGEITGTIYNKYLISGDFFKIPVLEELTLIPIIFEGGAPSGFKGEIDYQYLYY